MKSELRKFDKWPLNRGKPFKRGLFNRVLTVILLPYCTLNCIIGVDLYVEVSRGDPSNDYFVVKPHKAPAIERKAQTHLRSPGGYSLENSWNLRSLKCRFVHFETLLKRILHINFLKKRSYSISVAISRHLGLFHSSWTKSLEILPLLNN